MIPAHDEEGAIGATVRSCRALDYDPGLFSIHVIADNCTDATAREAREAGASVVERSDPDLRSKGHALEYFFTRSPKAGPTPGYDAAVLIDADTVVDPGLLKAFDRALGEGKDWVQGYYTVRNPDASWRTRMMTYAFSLANGVWMLGLDRLGLGVGLKGNGMCFSAAGLRRVPWKAHGLVEDMEFALMLRTRGERVRFEPDGPGLRRDGQPGRARGRLAAPAMGGRPAFAPGEIRRAARPARPPWALSARRSTCSTCSSRPWSRWPSAWSWPRACMLLAAVDARFVAGSRIACSRSTRRCSGPSSPMPSARSWSLGLPSSISRELAGVALLHRLETSDRARGGPRRPGSGRLGSPKPRPDRYEFDQAGHPPDSAGLRQTKRAYIASIERQNGDLMRARFTPSVGGIARIA